VDLIFGIDSEQSDIEYVNSLGIHVIQIPSFKKNISPFKDFKAVNHIKKIFNQNQYDIIHTHQSKAGFVGRLAARLSKSKPYVIHGIHGLSFNNFNSGLKNSLYIFLEKLAARWTDHFTSVSERLIGIMRDKKIIREKHKCNVIYSGMDLSRFTDLDQKVRQEEKEKYGLKDEFIVGMVSKLEPRKNYEDYLKIADYIVHENGESNVRFLVVGNGESEDTLKQITRDLKLTDHVIFTGYRSDVERVYSLFDCFLITSLAEGIPQVCVQAAAVGIPVLGYDIDGMSEIIFPDRNGYMAPVRQRKELADHLLAIIRDPDLKQRLSEQSPTVLKGRWEIDKMLKDVAELYDNIAQKLEA
jgi:glycosyltransferase involved in cell wall biosynthesis